jgi:hypothetical protein
MSIDLTPAFITGIAGVVISLLFEYVPKLHDWYNGLLNNYQKLVMLGIMVAIVAIIFGLNCAGWFVDYIPAMTCDKVGIQTAIVALVSAITANQVTYLISPKRDDKL